MAHQTAFPSEGEHPPYVTVVDCETTGLGRHDRIVEIAVVTVDPSTGEVVDEYDTLINPGRDTGPAGIHGIKPSMVEAAPTFSDIAGAVAARLSGNVLIAHNLPFDRRFLVQGYESLNVGFSPGEGLCTLNATKAKLPIACEQRGIPVQNAHLALHDARVTASLAGKVFDLQEAVASMSVAPMRFDRSIEINPRRLRRDSGVLVQRSAIARIVARASYPAASAAEVCYLDFVDHVLDDLRIDEEEHAEMLRLAHELGLHDAHVRRLHGRYLDSIVEAAHADERITISERHLIATVADALDLPDGTVPDATHAPAWESSSSPPVHNPPEPPDAPVQSTKPPLHAPPEPPSAPIQSAPPAPHDPRGLAPARALLREVFGYAEFRPGQAEVIASVLAARDTLAVLPTGGGKSVCYQLPALLLDGLAIVVSPLLALMKDQVDALTRDGVAAAAINSTVPREAQAAILRDAAAGDLRLLYVAPERFSDGRFMAALRGVRVSLLAVDEAHCISQWGHDFRPSYRDLGGVRARLGGPPVMALTATADPKVRADIVERLGLRDADVRVAGFDRPNLRFHAVRVKNQKEKLEHIAELLKALGNEASAIVYCATRKRVESLTEALQHRGIRCARYHAGMAEDDRARIQDAFSRDTLRVIVATNAFGLGIDKPDVRLVVHHDLPESIEAYYQEAGRAGRDGDAADCALLFAPRDRGLRDFFIELSHPPPATVLEVYRALVRRAGDRALIDDLLDGEEETPGINAAVQALVDSGLAERRGPFARALRPDGEDAIDLAGLEAHRAHATGNLDAMQAYAESATCLRARVLDYFGERNAPRSCGNCGPCLAPPSRRREPSAEAPLFMELRALRRRLAEEEGVPPFVIFSDATLHDMVAKRPADERALLAVHGVGRVKAERYGEAFLAVVRASRERARAEREERIRDVRELHPRAHDPWDAGEEARLREMRRHGWSINNIAAELQRQPSAIQTRLRQLEREAAGGAAARPLPSSARRTLEHHREGLSIGEIAERRGLSASTISQHLADCVERGDIADASAWIGEAELARLRRLAGGRPLAALTPMHEELDGALGWEELRIARAYLNRELAESRDVP